MMIFVLIVLERNQPTGEEFYFRELTSCVEYSNALNTQNVGTNNFIFGQNPYFKTYCRIRQIPTADAGTKIKFRDPTRPISDD
jgi:hypothetical protein